MNEGCVIIEVLSDGTPVYTAVAPDLRGCMAQGSTREAALEALQDARVDYVETLGADGGHTGYVGDYMMMEV